MFFSSFVMLYKNIWLLFTFHDKSNQIKSNHFYCHITSALVSEILTSVLQTVQKKIIIKNNLHMDSTYLQTVQKTMCKIHTYSQYTQCTIKTYLVINTHYTPYVHIYIMVTYT